MIGRGGTCPYVVVGVVLALEVSEVSCPDKEVVIEEGSQVGTYHPCVEEVSSSCAAAAACTACTGTCEEVVVLQGTAQGQAYEDPLNAAPMRESISAQTLCSWVSYACVLPQYMSHHYIHNMVMEYC